MIKKTGHLPNFLLHLQEQTVCEGPVLFRESARDRSEHLHKDRSQSENGLNLRI